VQFGARAHRLTKGAGKEKILSICVKNGQLHWQRHQQSAVKLAQKSDKYLDTGPTGKLFHPTAGTLLRHRSATTIDRQMARQLASQTYGAQKRLLGTCQNGNRSVKMPN